MEQRTVAIAGGSGFIGRAIARRLAAIAQLRPRVITRAPERTRERLKDLNLDCLRGEVTEPATLPSALAGADTVICAVQFDGFPIEDPARGLTFERVDYGGTVALLTAAKKSGASQFIYLSGAAADENSNHPAFRAKGRAERAVRESGLSWTILRPSLVYGPEDRVLNNFARLLRLSPVFVVPGSGRQKVQPILVDDLAAIVALAVGGKGHDAAFDAGGPDLMTFDEMVRVVMEVSGRRRPIIHAPEGALRMAARILEMLPNPPLTRDAITFVTADNVCDLKPLIAEFGIRLTPMREGIGYLAPKRR